jgi:hypothetical protein
VNNTKKLIEINFSGGSHGNFLKILVTGAFTNIWPITIFVPGTGTSHNWQRDTQYQSSISNQNVIINSAHFFNALFDNLSDAPMRLSNNLILVDSSHETCYAILFAWWWRIFDRMPFTLGELEILTKTQFINNYNEWYTTAKSARQKMSKFNKWIEHSKLAYDKIVSYFDEEKFNTNRAILNWNHPNEQHTFEKIFKENLTSTDNVYIFNMMWFYDINQCLNGLKEIGKYYDLPMVCSDEKLIEVITEFNQKLKQKPNIKETIEVFNTGVLNNKEIDIVSLPSNDQIYLLGLCIAHFKFNYNPFIKLNTVPKTTTELLEFIQRELNENT